MAAEDYIDPTDHELIDESAVAAQEAKAAQAKVAARLKGLGIYNSESAANDAYARILVLGPPKLGKTTCVALGAPKPLIINCDGLAATKGAASQGAQFVAVDADDRQSWKDACKAACELARDGVIQSIIVDTITLMQDSIIDDCQAHGLDGRDLWGEVLTTLTKGIKLLKMAPAHLFVIAHQIPGAKEDEGILPMLAGQAAQKIPAMLHDTALFIYDEDRRHEIEAVQHRFFALGPQGKWRYSGRNIKVSCQVPADIGCLFGELGIPL